MPDLDTNEHSKDNPLLKKESIIQKHLAFAAGIFHDEVNIRTLLESLGQGVVIIDNHGVILLVNAHAEQMFGYKSADIIGKHHDILIPKRLLTIHKEHMEHYLKEPKIRPMGRGLALVGVRSDGAEFPIEISLSFIKTKSTLLVINLISDISFRVEIEMALQTQMKELADTNSALESFSYSVSHDLRAPLATMIGLSQVLKEEYSDKIDKDGRTYLENIIISGTKMNQLISDMLDLSRISKQGVVWQECDLGEIAKSIVDDMRKAELSRGIEINIHEGLKTRGDPRLLTIVLSNLLRNAWKFTRKTKSPFIEFGAMWQENKKVFFIKDNGVGFEINEERMFKPFQRMHSDNEFPGTGIGLAIVDRVIKRHEGKIWAESTPGKGSTFYFTLAV
jgi:PAS domain S-box-containing protein